MTRVRPAEGWPLSVSFAEDRRVTPARIHPDDKPPTVPGDARPVGPPGLPVPDDEELIVARARRDLREFGPLYDRYADAVFGFCLRRLLDREAAADATHQTFAQAMTRLDSFRGQSFRAWLFAIARNVVIDTVRRRRPIDPFGDDTVAALVDPDRPPDEQAIAAERQARLLAAFDDLTPDQRVVVELRLAGLTAPEIGQALGKTANAVQTLQFRAYRTLRRLLAADPAFDLPFPVANPDDPSPGEPR
ncbi:MAG TPA: sigma-70 family RNA polymerase sigma factor [Thermomicrobiales bacterium]|nr:sigma-70 family RNA polymerase sigma factor [Thermomicrobiales bacterium]